MSASAEYAAGRAPRLLGVGAAWLVRTRRGARACGALVETLCAAHDAGWSVALLSPRGGDPQGSLLARSLTGRGIADLGVVFLDRETPACAAAEAPAGPAFGIYDFAFAKQLRRRHFRDAAGGADAIVVDSSLPEAALARLLDTAQVPVLAVESAVGDAARLVPHLPRLAAAAFTRKSLERLLELAPRRSLGTVAGALVRAQAQTVIAVGEGVSFRFQEGAVTLLDGRRDIAALLAAELPPAARLR